MKKLTYSEQLKDPRWQKRRLEILNRDSFTCRQCECNYKPLHVHHLGYKKDGYLWEVHDDQLITFCEDCHKHITERYEYAQSLLRIFSIDHDLMLEAGRLLNAVLSLSVPELAYWREIIERNKQ